MGNFGTHTLHKRRNLSFKVYYARYIPALQGVVLAHDNLQFLGPTATIKADCPFSNCRVRFDATVWSPQVGMKLSEFVLCRLCRLRELTLSQSEKSIYPHRTISPSSFIAYSTFQFRDIIYPPITGNLNTVQLRMTQSSVLALKMIQLAKVMLQGITRSNLKKAGIGYTSSRA